MKSKRPTTVAKGPQTGTYKANDEQHLTYL